MDNNELADMLEQCVEKLRNDDCETMFGIQREVAVSKLYLDIVDEAPEYD